MKNIKKSLGITALIAVVVLMSFSLASCDLLGGLLGKNVEVENKRDESILVNIYFIGSEFEDPDDVHEIIGEKIVEILAGEGAPVVEKAMVNGKSTRKFEVSENGAYVVIIVDNTGEPVLDPEPDYDFALLVAGLSIKAAIFE